MISEHNENNLWQTVWERKGHEGAGVSLKELIAMDGFDSATGHFEEQDWRAHGQTIFDRLRLSPDQNVLEVGCGAGAMLYLLQNRGLNLYGIDYSNSLVAKAKQAIPELTAIQSEAKQVPFPNKFFQRIFSHGVFFYFPNYDYATQTLDEMHRVATKEAILLILDVADLDKKTACEAFRQGVMSNQDQRRQIGYHHLYYPKSFFYDYAQRENCQIEIWDDVIPGYLMSNYRFHVSLRLDRLDD